jgi:hypothetical protein
MKGGTGQNKQINKNLFFFSFIISLSSSSSFFFYCDKINKRETMLVLFGTPYKRRMEDNDAKKAFLQFLKRQEVTPDPMSANFLNKQLLTECCQKSQDQASVIRLLSSYPWVDVNTRGDKGRTPLAFACITSQLPAVIELLSNPRVDVNSKFTGKLEAGRWVAIEESSNYTPLLVSVFLDNLDVVKYLVALRGKELDLQSLDQFFGAPSPKTTYIIRKILKKDMITLIQELMKDPVKTSARLRWELEVCVSKAARVFALLVMTCDDFFQIYKVPEDKEEDHKKSAESEKMVFEYMDQPEDDNTTRFIQMAIKLPMELQMILCLLIYDMKGVIIPSDDREFAFDALCKEEQ